MAEAAPSIDAKLATAVALKEAGNEFFKAGNYAKALGKYTKIYAYATGIKQPPMGMEQVLQQSSTSRSSQPSISSSQSSLVDSLILQANNNVAACHLKLNDPKKAEQYATKVIQQDPNNAKAYFRRGLAFSMLHDSERAEEDLKEALRLNPSDAAVRQELAAIKKKNQAANEKMRTKFAAGFADMRLVGKTKEQEKPADKIEVMED
jgi:peptidyl-prolyl isomerase D